MILTLFFLLVFSPVAFSIEAYFSPHQGSEAFEKIFKRIREARKSVYVTVYSWRDQELAQSLRWAVGNRLCLEYKNFGQRDESCGVYGEKSRAAVYVVMDKRHEKSKLKTIEALEKWGVQVRVSVKGMHEKFVVVDDRFVMNTSANFSPGAKAKYSESFVAYFLNEDSPESLFALKDKLKREFALIWNAGREQKGSVVIHPALPMESLSSDGVREQKEVEFLSSSVNFEIKSLSKVSKKGVYTRLFSTKTTLVADRIVELIDGAGYSIALNINYLLLEPIYKALIRAYSRGVSVRIVNDNKNISSSRDYSNRFASYVRKENPKAPCPTRFKFYSFAPSPTKSFLNHHKYILVDYYWGHDASVRSNTVLIAGSHNLSKTAETEQFDNMIVFKTSLFESLYHSFAQEFEHLWFLGRNEQDQPSENIRRNYLVPVRGKYRFHAQNIDFIVTLTSQEMRDLKKDLKKLAPKIMSRETSLSVLKRCTFYSPETQKYYNNNHELCP